MYFAEEEQKRYASLIKSDRGQRLFPNGYKQNGIFHDKVVSHRIDSRYSNENLEPSIRE